MSALRRRLSSFRRRRLASFVLAGVLVATPALAQEPAETAPASPCDVEAAERRRPPSTPACDDGATAASEAPEDPPGRPLGTPQQGGSTLQRGGIWSVFYGYGYPQRINGSAEHAIASGGVRYSYVGALKGSGPLRGHPSFALEVLPAMAFFPINGEPGGETFGTGGNVVYEHRFAPRGRWMPVWRAGAGVVYTGKAIPVGEERFNFSLLTGLGLEIQVSPGGALFVEYRFHHVSNANRGPINPGINAHTVLLGFSFQR